MSEQKIAPRRTGYALDGLSVTQAFNLITRLRRIKLADISRDTGILPSSLSEYRNVDKAINMPGVALLMIICSMDRRDRDKRKNPGATMLVNLLNQANQAMGFKHTYEIVVNRKEEPEEKAPVAKKKRRKSKSKKKKKAEVEAEVTV